MGVGRKISTARAWYPSGPRIDGSYSEYIDTTPDRNPDPKNYKILVAEEHGGYGNKNKYLIVKLQYPNCTNFEGIKILVFKDIKLIDLLNQKLIDPHFFENKNFASPIARFVPTDEGWKMALAFVNAMEN